MNTASSWISRNKWKSLLHLDQVPERGETDHSSEKEWARKGGPNEEYYHPLEEINVATFTKEEKIDPEEITEWDSGEKEKIPYVDLSQD